MDETQRQEEIKQIVIARLGTLNQNSKILLMDEKEPLTVSDMIKEVEDESDLGKRIIAVHFSFMKMLASGELDR